MKEIGVYIHIPFCESKCYYCDFVSFPNMEKDFLNYTNALLNEIKNSEYLLNYKIKSIFFGGGTPSILPEKYIEKILLELNNFNINNNCEITLEANPKTLTKEKLKFYKESKINRLSIGLQSDNNKLLKKLGRIHSYEDFLENYNDAREIGFENISIDLMFGIPNQTLEIWKNTLETIVNLKPEHISAYSLIIEEGTVFGKLYQEKKLILPTENTDRIMYSNLKQYLKKKNYLQYEVSNFALKQKESIHNIIYWERENYVGFGLDAHSFVNDFRFNNTNILEDYILGKKIVLEKTFIDKDEAIEEYIFLGLRMNKGINITKFNKIFNKDFLKEFGYKLDEFIKNNYLKVINNRIFLTSKGLDISNYIIGKILM